MIKYVTVKEACDIYGYDLEPGEWFVIENIQYMVF